MLMRTLQAVLAAIFLLSAIGKALYPTQTALSLAGLFALPAAVARAAVVMLVLLELAIAILIVLRRGLGLIQWIPVVFFMVFFYSLWQNRACGCFGELPILQNLPPAGHGVLLLGMFTGLHSLHRSTGAPGYTGPSARRRVMPLLSLALLAIALLSIPLGDTGTAPPAAGEATATLDDVWHAIDTDDAVLIDARSPFQYDIGHIPGAINIPVDTDTLPAVIERHQLRERELIVYCAGPFCDVAERLAARLRELGLRRVRVFPGGWEEWTAQE